MKQYLDLLTDVMTNGVDTPNRTGINARSVFGRQLRFNLENGFPLLTTKKMWFRGIVQEFIWMVVNGSVDVTELERQGNNIWSAWKGSDGTIGQGYGINFRRIQDGDQIIDQVSDIITSLRADPDSRRHVMSMWQAQNVRRTTLHPCHGTVIQFNSHNGKLDLSTYQRSADLFLGFSWNIAFYAIFLHVMAQLTNHKVGELVYSLGSAHVYHNHFDAVYEQLSREPLPLSSLNLNLSINNIDNFLLKDFSLEGYNAWPAIKAPVAI